MNEVLLLLSELEAKQVSLSLKGKELSIVAPKGVLTTPLKLKIKKLKPAIINLLSDEVPDLMVSKYTSIPAIPKQNNYALSNAQRRLWVLSQLEEGLAAYNMPAAIRIEGALDVDALEKAFEGLINRHESLRTRFVAEKGGTPRQVADPPAAFQLPRIDWRGKGQPKTEAYLKAHAAQVFDLSEGPLLKAELLQTGEDSHILLLNMHHIISDGWSMEVLFRELSALYDAAAKGQENPLPALKIQYKDYAAWQNNLLSDNKRMAELRGYWRECLANLPVLELPADYPRPSAKSYRGGRLHHTFSPEVSERLERLSRESGASLFMALTALVKVLLYRYTNQEDILVGTPTAGRNHPDLHGQVGFYVNTLVLRDRLSGEDAFSQTLAKVKETALSAFERELYPFDQLVEELDIERDQSRNPIFDVMVVLQNNERSALKLGDTVLSPIPGQSEISKFGLTFGFAAGVKGLQLSIEYSTDLFRQDRIERMAGHLEALIESVLTNPVQPISRLNILPQAERQLLLTAFNGTKADFPKDKTIISLFEEQVEKTPDNIAVVFDDRELSYRQINEQANRVGHYLRETYDIQPDDVIALQLERSEWMVIAILGVLKAGAAYLPIDPNFPKTRVEYMLEDSRPKVLLTDEASWPMAREFEGGLPVEAIEQLAPFTPGPASVCSGAGPANPSSLAYIIYTSGSTGRPKGVMNTHQNVVQLLFSEPFLFDFGEKDVWTLFHYFGFDFSVWEIWGALLNGGQVVVVPKAATLDPVLFADLLIKRRVTVLNQVPSTFGQVKGSLLQRAEKLALRYIIFGGAPLLPGTLRQWHNSCPGVRLVNMYGITETTVHVTFKEIDEEAIEEGLSNVGRPLPTYNCLILNEKGLPAPIGIAGEICVSGPGLARGYQNNAELTAERFIPHPYRPGERLYKSGDLGRWLPTGEIEHLGRIGHQLKIRGYRIEAGEVEQALLQHPSVQSAVVEGRELGQGKELVAYLVAGEGGLAGMEELRRHLSERLPGYMIPSYFVELEAMPLTTNGKVDRKALLGPDAGCLTSGAAYIAPRNNTEATLVEIWEKVLQRSGIGIHDNFFELGGHSLRAIRLTSLIKQQFSVEIKLREIFAQPTVVEIADRIIKAQAVIKLKNIESNRSNIENLEEWKI